MRRFGRDIAAARRPQPLQHLPQQRQDGDDLVAFAFRHVEPEPGQRLIQFLSGHVSVPFIDIHYRLQYRGR
jgi:hypothetical protein